VLESEILEIVNAETWLTGADASEYFNIEVSESVDAVAQSSKYLEMCGSLPANLFKSEKTNPMKECLKTKPSESNAEQNYILDVNLESASEAMSNFKKVSSVIQANNTDLAKAKLKLKLKINGGNQDE